MKPANSKAKGSSFERLICKRLSLWLSDNERIDLFTRNVLSGGMFTLAEKLGIQRGTPGDVMAAHPLAYNFLEKWFVEAKHWKDLGLDGALWKQTGQLYKVILNTRKVATNSNRRFLLIVKQNNWPILVFMNAGNMSFTKALSVWHLLWQQTTLACLFDEFVNIDPKELLK